jgi:hypothetical protein
VATNAPPDLGTEEASAGPTALADLAAEPCYVGGMAGRDYVADLDAILRTNPGYVDELYRSDARDPGSVGKEWAQYFAGYQLGSNGHGPDLPKAEAANGVFDLIHS